MSMDIKDAIEFLEEQYQHMSCYFGSADSCRLHNQKISEVIDFLEELQQYRQIGTVDECRAAREKEKPKEPIDDEYGHKCCPSCGWCVCYDEGWGDKYVPHCENCGQALKWGE